ncbi:MAG: biotin-independent malonate decarboxylase subunit gamma [Betaproteobacteria bacterium]|nr:biotin-independent malonate decarboxylase subunit gamma [Betaproteobacteria bacterium]
MRSSKQTLLDRLFPMGHAIAQEGLVLRGWGETKQGRVHVIGTTDHAAIDTRIALTLSDAVLKAIAADGSDPRPIVFIADTQGQALSRREELLGLHGYFAHLARCVNLARQQGHRLVTLIDGEAVSGGFLAFGLLADCIVALPGAEVRVMDLRAMARITRIPFERLTELAQISPVFAPGAENYWRMGGIHALWTEAEDWSEQLLVLLQGNPEDERARLGAERGGRMLAAIVAQQVFHAH